MKIPIVWPAVIFAALIAFGVGDHLKLLRLRDRNEELAVEIAVRADASRDTPVRRQARDLVNECLSISDESKPRFDTPRGERRKAELRQMELLDQVGSMGPGEVEEFLAGIRAAMRPGAELPKVLYGALQELSNLRPKPVLELFSQIQDGPTGSGGEEWTVCVALRQLAEDDPSDALQWIDENPGFLTERVKREALSGAARADPALAFELVGEWGIERPESIVSGLVYSARTAGERADMVAALREYIPNIPDETLRKRTRDDAFGNFARGVVADGFENGSKWLNQAGLTQEELAGFADGLTSQMKGPETGRWVEWVGTTLQDGGRDGAVRSMMFYWAGNDPSGAASWLGEVKDSQLRNSAISGYVDCVSGYEPETAIEWALALPAGKTRENAFRLIHRKWPRHDPAQKAAAEAFAKDHGIE
ncbi:MAG: hypothetical protein V4689_16215 [Verrucomicrobiota bacterium]